MNKTKSQTDTRKVEHSCIYLNDSVSRISDGMQAGARAGTAHVHPERDVRAGDPGARVEEARVPGGSAIHEGVEHQDNQGGEVEGSARGEDHVAQLLVDVALARVQFLPPAQGRCDAVTDREEYVRLVLTVTSSVMLRTRFAT